MKKYMQPIIKVLEISAESVLSASPLNTYDDVSTDDDYTRRKSGWCSELWAKSGDEIDF